VAWIVSGCWKLGGGRGRIRSPGWLGCGPHVGGGGGASGDGVANGFRASTNVTEVNTLLFGC